MTYELDDRQYVVIAGGNPRARAKPGDAVVAFALPNRPRLFNDCQTKVRDEDSLQAVSARPPRTRVRS
jgi:hypothetical protein